MLIKLLFVISVLIAGCISNEVISKDAYPGELLYRLPSNVKPSYYDLKIKIDLADVDDLQFEGEVTINIEILEETKSIPINYNDIEVDWANVVLVKNDSTRYNYDTTELQKVYDIAYIRFVEILPVGFYSMTLSFMGKIRNDLKGLYKSTYGTNKFIATTHFEPSYARMAFPCFDEPHFKAIFKITIEHNEKYKALSNMHQVTAVGPTENGFISTTFEETPVMSTYLVAFIVSEYEKWGIENDLYVAYAPPGEESHTNDSIRFAPKAMKALEEFLGVDYQLTLVQLVSINDFLFGAMENWGLVTFRSEYILYPDLYISPRIHQHSRLLISHEFAHMWFGNEVTPEWWTYVWLSEGFAQFFQYYTTDELEPSWRIWEQFNVNNLQSALSQDDNSNIRAMSEPIIQPSETQFDYIVYAKSSSIIRMFYEIIGESAFKTALNEYLTKNSYKTVVPENLFESFQSVIDSEKIELPKPFAELFESWSNELGYPVINAEVDMLNQQIIVSQKRFFVDPDLMKISVKGNYYIPITIATDNVTENYGIFWLSPDVEVISFRFDASAKFVVLNKLQVGYYRVNYKEEYWLYLAEFLSDKDNIAKISEENRAQLIDDAANLAKAGLVSYDILFKLLYILKDDLGFLPWMAASNTINFLTRMLLDSAQYGRFENFLRIISNSNYEQYGLYVDYNEHDHVERLHRINSVAWACQYGHTNCLTEVRGIINKLVTDDEAQADEIRPIVFCTFSRYTDINDELVTKLMVKIYTLLGSSDEVTVRQINEMITGIGCTRNSTYITYIIETLTIGNGLGINIDTKTRARIAVAIINGSYEGVQIMIRFLTDRFTNLRNWYESAGIESVLNALGPRIVTEDVSTLFNSFVTNHKTELTDYSLYDAATKAQATAAANVKWRKTYGGDIEKWLQNNVNDTEPNTSTPTPASSSIVILSRAVLFIAIAAMLRQFI